jgi:hypothetical protein
LCSRAFPSKATAARKKQLNELTSKVGEVEQRIADVDQKTAEASGGREDGVDRERVLVQIL